MMRLLAAFHQRLLGVCQLPSGAGSQYSVLNTHWTKQESASQFSWLICWVSGEMLLFSLQVSGWKHFSKRTNHFWRGTILSIKRLSSWRLPSESEVQTNQCFMPSVIHLPSAESFQDWTPYRTDPPPSLDASPWTCWTGTALWSRSCRLIVHLLMRIKERERVTWLAPGIVNLRLTWTWACKLNNKQNQTQLPESVQLT